MNQTQRNRRRGTQSLERAARVLREVASRGRLGWGLRDLAVRCELDHSTTHRLLTGLMHERLVRQRRSDRRYLPGPLLFELSLSMPWHGQLVAAARPGVSRLHRRFGTMAAMFLRSGTDSVCAIRAGTPPYVGARLEEGTRGALMANAGGAAMLIALPAEEREAVTLDNRRQLAHLGEATTRRLDRIIRRSEGLGYAFNQSEVTRGVHSFGVAIGGPEGDVIGSLAVSGTAEDFPSSRAGEVIAALREEAAVVAAAAAKLLAI